jgi:hypothetical protein
MEDCSLVNRFGARVVAWLASLCFFILRLLAIPTSLFQVEAFTSQSVLSGDKPVVSES